MQFRHPGPFFRPGRRSLCVFLALAAAIPAGGLRAQPPPEAPRGRIDLGPLLASRLEASGSPALGAAIADGSSLRALGVAGLREHGQKEPVEAGDLWHLGSCTKAMTATLAGVLHDRSILSLDAPLESVWPEGLHESYRKRTVMDLLAHTSGLPANAPPKLWATMRDARESPADTRKRVVRAMLESEPGGPSGSFLYSNAGYMAAGAAMEAVTGKTCEDLLREEVFKPLGMASAGFGAPGSRESRDQPRGHIRRGESLRPVPPGPLGDNPPSMAPAGTVHMTLEDWARFASAHVAGGGDGHPLLRPATWARLHGPREGEKYAGGFGVAKMEGIEGAVLAHAGSNTLWYSLIWVSPGSGRAYLAVANAAGDGVPAALTGLLRELAASGR